MSVKKSKRRLIHINNIPSGQDRSSHILTPLDRYFTVVGHVLRVAFEEEILDFAEVKVLRSGSERADFESVF
jgi:hypothetical protein